MNMKEILIKLSNWILRKCNVMYDEMNIDYGMKIYHRNRKFYITSLTMTKTEYGTTLNFECNQTDKYKV